jgi:hypothetical protein
MRPIATVLFVLGALFAWPGTAHAGMPRVTTMLSEMARLRLQSISFFLVGFLLAALLVQVLWNSLRRDFSILPRLSYFRAVGLVGLWGLLFILVLTMISGARELMTPGAWELSGATYRLAQKRGTANEEQSVDSARKEQLERLKEALWRYAKGHGGHFPSSQSDPAIAPQRWLLPDESGMQYVYAGGVATPFEGVPLAYEPEVFGRDRWVLFTNGVIRQLTTEEIDRALAAEKK